MSRTFTPCFDRNKKVLLLKALHWRRKIPQSSTRQTDTIVLANCQPHDEVLRGIVEGHKPLLLVQQIDGVEPILFSDLIRRKLRDHSAELASGMFCSGIGEVIKDMGCCDRRFEHFIAMTRENRISRT